MSIDPKLLRDTLEVALATDDFPDRFYERLFAKHPEVRPLFKRNSDGAQRKMFAQKLCMIVDSIEDSGRIAAEVRKVAESHAEYGVSMEMYGWVGTALIETLREANGDGWSESAEASWTAAYAALTEGVLASSPRR